ncbi:uncharacterized protein GGS25DRAFT_491016 [Hypoxylon fragiforme]|uniref:uncharacterized protein n=1 Tax=Hypoxylon fragiforme TaxID=63214 RepID=UPI0020C69E2C|nr:uncharacterized protein GGS25DRAFT_491016 [Hypoxylon fragiforme]KAI2608620.1 hypothetical protein GGS25DRAFT_491016 [Hypoxylon fragiforme]
MNFMKSLYASYVMALAFDTQHTYATPLFTSPTSLTQFYLPTYLPRHLEYKYRRATNISHSHHLLTDLRPRCPPMSA